MDNPDTGLAVSTREQFIQHSLMYNDKECAGYWSGQKGVSARLYVSSTNEAEI